MVIENTPDRDASLGLIFRLNNLWAEVDYVSVNADYKKWNYLLDAIYRNLLHNRKMISIVDKQGKKKLILCEDDVKAYRHFSMRVTNAKKEYNHSRTRLERNKKKSLWYYRLQMKDVWLRKFMQEQKLYMKQSEQRPGSAMYGTYTGGKT